MARVLLVLICAVLVFAVVSKLSPGFIEEFLPQRVNSPGEPTPVPEEKKPPVRLESAKGKLERSAKAAAPAPAAPDSRVSEATTRAAAVTPAEQPAKGSSLQKVFSVATESAPLYSTNTSAGPLVSVLKKGDIVEPQFVLNSAGQEWTFVSVAGQKVSGFVRSDYLGTYPQTAGRASR